MDAVIVKIEPSAAGYPEIHYQVTGKMAERMAETADLYGDSIYLALGKEVFKSVGQALIAHRTANGS